MKEIFYFCDKHESVENIEARLQFISTYFMLEIRVYHWVHVPETTAIYLSNDYGIIDAYHPFTKHGELYREYHVDTHPILFQYVRNNAMGGDLLVRKEKRETNYIHWTRRDSV